MADTSNLSQFLTDVAGAIKEKTGKTDKIPAANFDTEIKAIETGVDTSDATAVSMDIIAPKTAYVKGNKVTGGIIPTYVITNPDFKLLYSGQLTESTYRIRAMSYKYNFVLIDTLNTSTSGGSTKYVNVGYFSDTTNTIIVTDTKIGPTNFGFSSSALISGIDVRASLTDKNKLLIVCAIIESSKIYFVACKYDLNTSTILEYKVSSNYISGQKTSYNTVRPYIHPTKDLVICTGSTYLGYIIIDDTFTIKALSSSILDQICTISYSQDYKHILVSVGTLTKSELYLVNYDFDAQICTLIKLAAKQGRFCYVNNLIFKIQSEKYEIYSLENNALNLLYEGIHSYKFDIYNAAQMIALDNYIFYYDISRSYRFILNEVTYGLTTSNISGGDTISNNYQTSNSMNIVNKNEDDYHIFSSNNNIHAYIHTISGIKILNTITINNDVLFNTSQDTATSSALLESKTAHTVGGKIIGTMPNNGELTYTPSQSAQTIPAGYTSGGTVNAIDYSNTLTPAEYTTALDTANEILTGMASDM